MHEMLLRLVARPDGLPSVPVVEESDWREHCGRSGLTSSDSSATQARTFRRHRNILNSKGLIGMAEGYVWATDTRGQSPDS